MPKNRILRVSSALLVVVCMALSACSGNGEFPTAVPFVPTIPVGPVVEIDGTNFLVHHPTGTVDFMNGINLGATVPGHQPGELAPTAQDFRRWFPQMAELGFQVVRIYTIQQPHFYEEFRSYNEANPSQPLYLMHGVWIPEERFIAAQDLFDEEVRSEFLIEIDDAVAAVHGDNVIADKLGHASGTYTADVSPWLAGWIIGVELDPLATRNTDDQNVDIAPFAGEFFGSSEDATPTAVWLAEMLDRLAQRQTERGQQVPLAFTNWPTTDPLIHPDEPLEREDLVQVDANHVRPTDRWAGGYFASYHAYPYYPDFQRYEDGIADYVAADGRVDNYAGYLQKLRQHHGGIPVLIAEFGVPSGSAHAHFGPLGRDQGGHDEATQMEINADLLRVIDQEGLAGGLLFEWADEWFKFTWNTIDYELPGDRRAMWTNAWTNEAHFGIVAVEPGASPVVVIDGDPNEWLTNGSQVVFEGDDGLHVVRAVKDEGYVYLLLSLAEPLTNDDDLVIGFDVLAELGGGLPGAGGQFPESDYAIDFSGPERADALVAAYNDPMRILAGSRQWIDWDDVELEPGSGEWNVQSLIVNGPLVAPSTGQNLPIEVIEPGRLITGSTNPNSSSFDSRTSFSVDGSTVEIRLPHMAVGFADPSSLQAYRIRPDGSAGVEAVDRIGIDIVLNGVGYSTAGYAWEQWQQVSWHERLKVNAAAYTEAMKAAAE